MTSLPMTTTDTGERITIRESNERGAALGRYTRWVYRRYQRLDIVEMTEMVDAADPISLRQVYVPMRVAEKDVEYAATEVDGGPAADPAAEHGADDTSDSSQ